MWNEDNLNEQENDSDYDDVESEGYKEHNTEVTVSSSEAVDAFNKAIRWSENNIFNVDDLLVLRKCRDYALQKSLSAKKVQQQITKYFNKV